MKESTKAAKPTLLEALNYVDAGQLEEIDQRIAALDKERESLVAARKIIDIKLNGKPERAKPQRKAKANAPVSGKAYSESDEELRDQVYSILTQAKRPLKPAAIAAEIGISGQKVGQLTNHEWFIKDIDGIRIA